jgi:amidase
VRALGSGWSDILIFLPDRIVAILSFDKRLASAPKVVNRMIWSHDQHGGGGNMRGAEILDLDAAGVAAAIAAGAISSREAAAAHLARLDAVNPRFNAVVEVMREDALAAADAIDAARARGERLGPLAGVPVTVKLNVDVAGRASSLGLVALKDRIADSDSPAVANLRKAGAVLIGRTNIPDFSLRWHTDNALHGPTINPWDPRLTVGGSSGGAAAATAMGIGALAHGNDVAGSLRLPASACGVYGFKPTPGVLPRYNATSPVEPSLALQLGATEGVIARSTRDLRLGVAALAATDCRDPLSRRAPAPDLAQRRPRRVALFTGETEFGTSAEVAALVRRAGACLEAEGYRVEERAAPHFGELAELWMAILHAEITSAAREDMNAMASEGFRRSFADTAACLPALNAEGYQTAWRRRHAILRAWTLFLDDYPILLTPTSCRPTFPADHDARGVEIMREILQAYAPLAAMAGAGLPAISVPAGMAAGAPAGVQIVAGAFCEERCLEAAAILERRLGPTRPIAPAPA